ncbi:unannotated protein [freshwater metagenome]|uniref:Unannotated protein n=1 Tax=freshwater metagenome TaxID=449393 RepID=A0A6J6HUJ0_9ZZZZ
MARQALRPRPSDHCSQEAGQANSLHYFSPLLGFAHPVRDTRWQVCRGRNGEPIREHSRHVERNSRTRSDDCCGLHLNQRSTQETFIRGLAPDSPARLRVNFDRRAPPVFNRFRHCWKTSANAVLGNSLPVRRAQRDLVPSARSRCDEPKTRAASHRGNTRIQRHHFGLRERARIRASRWSSRPVLHASHYGQRKLAKTSPVFNLGCAKQPLCSLHDWCSR